MVAKWRIKGCRHCGGGQYKDEDGRWKCILCSRVGEERRRRGRSEVIGVKVGIKRSIN